MTFAIADEFLPAVLTCHPMSDKEFAAFCAEHPDLNFEMTADGELIVMAPTYSDTGVSNSNISAQLETWARKDGRGFSGDPQSGFVLPNGARRSPDASWTLKSRVRQLRRGGRKSFWHLCPDFVIELRSENDRMKPLREKMREYMEQGAQLGWLLNPKDRTVEIYRAGGEVEKLPDAEKIEGEGPVAGFVLDLKYVWDPLAD
jgi:Uma2 family endonuclease